MPSLSSRSRARRSLVCGLAVIVTAPLVAGPAGAEPTDGSPAERTTTRWDSTPHAVQTSPEGRTSTAGLDEIAPGTVVVLLGGDRVVVAPQGAAGPPYEVQPAPRADGRTPAFATTSADGRLSVVPRELLPLVGEVLDPALFDVAALAAAGAGADGVPVLVQPAPGRTTWPAALSDVRELPELGHASATVTAAAGPALVADVLDGGLDGVERLWLDHPVTSTGATTADGVDLQVPVGFHREAERYDLTVRVLDTAGEPFTTGGADIFATASFTEGFFPYEELDDDGQVTVRVRPGAYSVTSLVDSPDGTTSIVADPAVEVVGDTTVVLDAREANPVSVRVDGVDARLTQADLHYSVADEEGRSSFSSIFPDPALVEAGKIRVTPTDPAPRGRFDLVGRWRLETPAVGDDLAELWDLTYDDSVVPDLPAYVHDPSDTSAVETVRTTYRALGTAATVPSYRASWSDVTIVAFATEHPLALPTERVEHVLAHPTTTWYACASVHPTLRSKLCEEARPARGGADRASRWLDVVAPATAALQRWDDVTLFAQVGLGDGGHRGQADFELWERTALELRADGELVDGGDGDFAYLTVPPGEGTYALGQDAAIRPGAGPLVREARTTWQITTDTPPEGMFEETPHLLVGYRPGVDLLGRASAGEGLKLGLRTRRAGEPGERAPVEHAALRVSDDGGETWTDLRLRVPDGSDGTRFLTRVPRHLLQTGRPLALQVEVRDADGLAVEQTLTEAIPVG